jgi:hypothetical protein
MIHTRESQEKITSVYLISKNLSSVGRMFNLDKRTIKNILVKNNIQLKFKVHITSEQENEIVNLYNNGCNITFIKQKFGVTHRRILEILNKYELTLRGNKRYSFNDKFFEKINSEEKSYWLGFIYADGGMYSDGYKCHQIFIKLALKDKIHLERFQSSIGSNHKLKLRTETKSILGKKEKTYQSIMIRITSKKMFGDLLNCGCFQNKSNTIKFPKFISPYLIQHFIRGYFDGDGSISKTSNTKQLNVLGNKLFLKDIQTIWMNTCNVRKTKLFNKGKIYSLHYGGNGNIEKIRNYLYTNATVWLDRKRDKFYS